MRGTGRWLAAAAGVVLLGASCGGAERPPAQDRAAPALAEAPAPVASPAGRIVFSRDDDVYSALVDGSKERRLTRRAGPEFDPSWSADGSRIAYRDSTHGINNDDEIFVMDADGSDRRNVTRNRKNDWGPAWSPDGEWIAFNSDRDLLPQIYIVRPDGSGLRRVTDIEGEYPAWSPDGTRLAFMSMRPGAFGSDPNYDVFVVNVDGTGLQQLTDWSGEDGWPSWSPDGRWIAFTTSQDDHRQIPDGPYFDIYTMKPDGSAKRRLITIFGMFPAWSPDSHWVVFSGSRLPLSAERLWVVSPAGGPPAELPIEGSFPEWNAG